MREISEQAQMYILLQYGLRKAARAERATTDGPDQPATSGCDGYPAMSACIVAEATAPADGRSVCRELDGPAMRVRWMMGRQAVVGVGVYGQTVCRLRLIFADHFSFDSK